ncbi:MAG: fibronectin type III-like domain-contianing protein, partial [Angelakisella sp.]
SGRLPISFPRKGGQLPVYYNQLPGWHGGSYCDCEATALFPFGFGLSYTTFEYGSLETDKDSYTKDDTIQVTLTVKNTGSRDAVETVQLYVHDKVCSMVSPVKQLADYKKLPIAAGETLTVTFRLPVSTLGFVDINNRYVVEPGEFEIMAGGSSRTEDLQLVTVRVK